jgi:hypothetical protein
MAAVADMGVTGEIVAVDLRRGLVNHGHAQDAEGEAGLDDIGIQHFTFLAGEEELDVLFYL